MPHDVTGTDAIKKHKDFARGKGNSLNEHAKTNQHPHHDLRRIHLNTCLPHSATVTCHKSSKSSLCWAFRSFSKRAARLSKSWQCASWQAWSYTSSNYWIVLCGVERHGACQNVKCPCKADHSSLRCKGVGCRQPLASWNLGRFHARASRIDECCSPPNTYLSGTDMLTTSFSEMVSTFHRVSTFCI